MLYAKVLRGADHGAAQASLGGTVLPGATRKDDAPCRFGQRGVNEPVVFASFFLGEAESLFGTPHLVWVRSVFEGRSGRAR